MIDTDKSPWQPPRLASPQSVGGAVDRFGPAFRVTRMPIVVTDPQQHDNPAIFVNDAFCAITGYGREEVLGHNLRLLQGSQTDPAAVARIRAAIRAGETIEIDLRNYRKDGTVFWNRLMIAPMLGDDGAIRHFIAVQCDVTLELQQLPDLEARNTALHVALAERLSDLEESESRFRHMADNAPVMVWTSDAAGACTWLSRSWSVFTGQNGSDGLGDGWRQAIHPEDRAMVQHGFADIPTTGSPVRREYRLRRTDGAYAWVIDAAAPRVGEDGSAMGYVGSILDITDRRNAEARLAMSEESLRLATEAAEIGTWDLDMVTGVLAASDRMKAMFGVAPQCTLTLADYRATVHPDDDPARVAAFAQAISPASRSTYDVEYRTIGKEDGVIRWVAAKGRGQFAGGHCLRAFGTTIDITARKAAQARQTLLMTLSEQVRLSADAGTVAQAVQHLLAQHFGASHVGLAKPDGDAWTTENPGRDIAQPALRHARLAPGLHAALTQGHVVALDPAEARQAPWTPLDAQALALAPLLRGGTLAGLLYLACPEPHGWSPEERTLIELAAAKAWDAMERIRAETALRDLNTTLETRVEQRAAELRQAEEALRQSQKMEAVGQLTGGIAHDFNNLLTGIMGALHMVQRRLGAGRMDGVQRYSDMAIASAQRAAALIQRLLAFARRQPLDPRVTDINRLVTDMEELLRHTIGPAIMLEMQLDAALWPTICDAHQLESAILNLAINARDAMVDRGRLTISTANVTLDEGYARAHGGDLSPGEYTAISVADTGAGMPPEVMARAFEPFFTTKPIGRGTGLGLSMLYGFTKQSDGHVRVESVLGQGTVLRLYLPRYHGPPATADQTAAPPTAAALPRHGTVLVVDDQDTVRALVVETLVEAGYVTLEAADGLAGLDILQSHAAIDLLVTDIGLPGLNGRQLADAARAARPDLRVLFMTGYDHDATMGNRVLDPGMEMMTKPFALAALAAKVQGMITAG